MRGPPEFFFEDRHFWEQCKFSINFGFGAGLRQVLVVVQFNPKFRHTLTMPFFACVQNFGIVRVFHQDEAGGVICVVLAAKLGQKIEQPCGSARFLLEDVGAKTKHEAESSKWVPQPQVLGIAV